MMKALESVNHLFLMDAEVIIKFIFQTMSLN
jgi:hypothetical protein